MTSEDNMKSNMILEDILKREEPRELGEADSRALISDSDYVISAVNFFLTELNRVGGGEVAFSYQDNGKAQVEMKYAKYADRTEKGDGKESGVKKQYTFFENAVLRMVERIRIMQDDGRIELVDYVETKRNQKYNYYLNSTFSTNFSTDAQGRISCRIELEMVTAEGKLKEKEGETLPERVIYLRH